VQANRSNNLARALLVISGTCCLPACHDVVEYSDEGTSGVHFIDASTMEIEGTLGGLEGARCMLYVDGDLLVVSNTGVVFWVDPGLMAVDRFEPVGQPFATGYTGIVEALEETVYILGEFDSFLEMSPGSGIVLDEFSAGPAPLAMAIEPGDSFMYVFDGSDSRVREVVTVTNGIVRDYPLPHRVGSVVPFDPENEIIEYRSSFVAGGPDVNTAFVVMVSDAAFIIESIPNVPFVPGPIADVAALEEETTFLTVSNGLEWGASGVSVFHYVPPPYTTPVVFIELDGTALRACSQGSDFFVVSWLGNDRSSVTRIDGYTAAITGRVDVPGYPWDIAPCGPGRIAILTTD
jgi:hypothetical protein